MSAKYEAIEQKNGTVFVYENGTFIGAIDLMNFPLAGFARIMRDANSDAPELLGALELARTVLEDIYSRESKSSFHGQRVRSDIDDNIGYIRAAIAKAKGQVGEE